MRSSDIVQDQFYLYLSRIKTRGHALVVSAILASACSLLSTAGTQYVFQNVDSPLLPVVSILAYMLPFLLVLTSSFLLIRGFAKLDQHNKYLSEVAERDQLTHLANRNTFFRRGRELANQAERQKTNLSMIMLDADHFKTINDTFGHLAGDMALQHLAEIMRQTSRESDLVARWGGEEFAIILRAANVTGARTYAERLRQTVAQSPFFWQGDAVFLTMSAGVTEWQPEEDDFETFVNRADQALYAAKSSGRNQVRVAGVIVEQIEAIQQDLLLDKAIA